MSAEERERDPDVAAMFEAFNINPDEVKKESQEESDSEIKEESQKTNEEGVKTEEESPASTEADTSENTEEEEKETRTNRAFAAMRAENKTYQRMISDFAEVLGIDPKSDVSTLKEALNNRIVKAQAEKQNISPDLLIRMRQLEEQSQQYAQRELAQQATLGFQNLKNTFNLTQKDLDNFAQQLASDGLNPYESPINLRAEYLSRNYEAVLEAKISEAVRKEQERAVKATENSSQPGNRTGKIPVTEGETPIKTVSDLEHWASKQGSK